MAYYHVDPKGLTLPRYYALLSQIGVIERAKAGGQDHHRQLVQRMEELRDAANG